MSLALNGILQITKQGYLVTGPIQRKPWYDENAPLDLDVPWEDLLAANSASGTIGPRVFVAESNGS